MKNIFTNLAGITAGIVNGLLGAGGGMVLVPLLEKGGQLQDKEVFPASVAIILPLCIVSLTVTGFRQDIPWTEAFPYLLGSIPGGILAGIWEKKIPSHWLHRALGLIIIWGGVRYLC